MKEASKQSASIEKYFIAEKKLLTAMAYFCGTLFLLYSFYVALEVVGRHFFGLFTGITDEIGGYVLALGGSVGLAYTLKAQGHVRIDVIFSFLPPKAKPWFDAIATLSMAIFALVVTDHLLDLTIQSHEMQATGHSLIEMPQWIMQSFVTFGYALLCFTAITSFIASVLSGLGKYKSDPLPTESH